MNIKPDILRSILLKDEHPFFQTYVIGHEGRTRPNVIGIGGKIINWTKDAIKTIKTVIKTGIKCFKGHNKDNSTHKRKEYGEIVGYIEKEINGKLNGVIITYHSPDIREAAKDFDICSQEALWEFTEDNNGLLNAETCKEITGIAFENSKNEQPAFADAKRLAMIQCFDETDVSNKTVDAVNNKDKKMDITFNDVLDFVKSRNITPSRLYEPDEIKADKKFSDIFQKYETEILNKDKEASKFKTDFELIDKKYKELETSTQRLTAKERLEKIVKEKNKTLTDNEKIFVFETIDQAKDFTDLGLETFLDNRQMDYKAFTKLNNIKDVPLPVFDKQNNQTLDITRPEHNEYL
jgi:hypothetical protein